MYLYTNKTVLQSILESTFSVQIFLSELFEGVVACTRHR